MSDEILIGVKELRDRLELLAKMTPIQAVKALYEEAKIEMVEAKRRTPWEFGVLKASGRVSKPVINGREISVDMQFGGPAVEYAIYVHEDLEALHPRGGQAKFLESTLAESAPFMATRLSRRLELK